jgi:hypothetical protein
MQCAMLRIALLGVCGLLSLATSTRGKSTGATYWMAVYGAAPDKPRKYAPSWQNVGFLPGCGRGACYPIAALELSSY